MGMVGSLVSLKGSQSAGAQGARGRGSVAWWKPPGLACQGNWFESCFWQMTWIEFLNQILFHYKTVIQIITLWGVV